MIKETYTGARLRFTGHRLAPENQEVFLRDRKSKRWLKVPQAGLNLPANGWLQGSYYSEMVRKYRALNCAKGRTGRYAVITVHVPLAYGAGSISQYKGFVSGYSDVINSVRSIKARHNLAGTTFEISTVYICG